MGTRGEWGTHGEGGEGWAKSAHGGDIILIVPRSHGHYFHVWPDPVFAFRVGPLVAGVQHRGEEIPPQLETLALFFALHRGSQLRFHRAARASGRVRAGPTPDGRGGPGVAGCGSGTERSPEEAEPECTSAVQWAGGAAGRVLSEGNRLAYPRRTGFRPVSDQCPTSVLCQTSSVTPCPVARRICGVHVSPCHVRSAESHVGFAEKCHVGCTVSFRICTSTCLDRNSWKQSGPILVGKWSINVFAFLPQVLAPQG